MSVADAWEQARQAWRRLAANSERPRGDDDGLASLSDIGAVRRMLDQAELAAVRTARRSGKSWAEIATHLGVTRQSAWERWRDLDDSPRGGESGRSAESTVLDDAASHLRAASGRENASAQRRRARVDRSARPAGWQGSCGDQCPTRQPFRPWKPRLGCDRPKPRVRRTGQRRIGSPTVAAR